VEAAAAPGLGQSGVTLRRHGRAKVKSFFGGEAGFWWSTISVRDFFLSYRGKLLVIIEVHYPDKTVQNFRASPVSCNLIETMSTKRTTATPQNTTKGSANNLLGTYLQLQQIFTRNNSKKKKRKGMERKSS
jgi:hypothetical protein